MWWVRGTKGGNTSQPPTHLLPGRLVLVRTLMLVSHFRWLYSVGCCEAGRGSAQGRTWMGTLRWGTSLTIAEIQLGFYGSVSVSHGRHTIIGTCRWYSIKTDNVVALPTREELESHQLWKQPPRVIKTHWLHFWEFSRTLSLCYVVTWNDD